MAPEAAHFEVAIPGIERVAQRRRWLSRSLKAEHAPVPRLAGELVRLPCGLPSPALPPPAPMRRKWSRVIWSPWPNSAPGRLYWASRYALWIMVGIVERRRRWSSRTPGSQPSSSLICGCPDAATCGPQAALLRGRQRQSGNVLISRSVPTRGLVLAEIGHLQIQNRPVTFQKRFPCSGRGRRMVRGFRCKNLSRIVVKLAVSAKSFG